MSVVEVTAVARHSAAASAAQSTAASSLRRSAPRRLAPATPVMPSRAARSVLEGGRGGLCEGRARDACAFRVAVSWAFRVVISSSPAVPLPAQAGVQRVQLPSPRQVRFGAGRVASLALGLGAQVVELPVAVLAFDRF